MAGQELGRDRAISKQLRRAWPAFFATFGRLTAVQRAVMGDILRGDDVLVCAATAAGKTEAACAPLVERNFDRTSPWTILYVSPTRALVNDLYERLFRPLNSLGLQLDRRTGDHRSSLGRTPHVLLTTPESFDSLLCRGRKDGIGHELASVTAVVLDEVHLFYGSARGEQLRWLLERLRRLRAQAQAEGWFSNHRVQVVGLSATLPDPKAVAEYYMSNGKMLIVPGSREIETVACDADEAMVESALPKYLAAVSSPEKVLVFANARRRVDELTAHLRQILQPLGYEVRAHHGSLDRKEREETENAARTQRRIAVVSTSTLEIGIDIGNIDLVVLDGPAPDIPALLQRIGRGNRRSNKTRVMACAASITDAVIQAAMIDAARNGWMGPAMAGPQHAVARQQTASYIFQAPRISRSRTHLQSLLDSCAAPIVGRSLITEMARAGELEEDATGVRLGAEWLEQAVRGEIHSTIEGTLGLTVEDEVSGQKIAHGVSYRGGKGLKVGGHLLQVRKWSETRLEVRKVGSEALAAGQWSYSGRSQRAGSSQPRALQRYLGFEPEQWPVIQDGRYVYAFHFGGSARQAVLSMWMSTLGINTDQATATPWFLCLETASVSKPRWLQAGVGPATLEVALGSRLEALEHALGRPTANRRLALDMRLDEVRGWLQLEREVEGIRKSEWLCELDDRIPRLLQRLISEIG